MLRLWQVKRTDSEPNSLTWIGEIEHIQTSQYIKFRSFDDLQEFLEEQLMSMDTSKYYPDRLATFREDELI